MDDIYEILRQRGHFIATESQVKEFKDSPDLLSRVAKLEQLNLEMAGYAVSGVRQFDSDSADTWTKLDLKRWEEED